MTLQFMSNPASPIPPFPPGPSGGPVEALTPEQLSEITHARHRYRKVRRAISVATFDAWTTAIFAAITLLGSLMGFSWSGILLGLGMSVVAFNSFRGMRLLEKADPAGARVLGRNQFLLAAVLLIYALWNLLLLKSGHYDLGVSKSMNAELQQAGYGSLINLGPLVYSAMYVGLAAFAILIQPLTALYYFSRRHCVEEYLQKTAPWVLQMQRGGFRL